ncbi:hypothetical protein F2P81_017572 [Scophthalmus maximus]|uniref:Uncharacterized protein n=1 Tax=Scophthalmus maximus TaxID=52904 RepID=A0A6A4SI77_SCOMX|nr:hypothetical protein F2P81_017572 [Scophthalmus maximus]
MSWGFVGPTTCRWALWAGRRVVGLCGFSPRSIKGNRVRFTGPVDGGHGGRGPGRNGFRSAACDKHSWPGQAKEVEETDMETSKVGHDCNSSTKRHRTHTSSHIIIIQCFDDAGF